MIGIAAVLVALGGAALLYGGPGDAPSLRAAALAAALVAAGTLLGARERRRGVEWGLPAILLAVAVVLAALPWLAATRRQASFLPGAELVAVWPYVLAAGAGVAAWLAGDRGWRGIGLLLVLQAALIVACLDYTQGALPTRDDHPSFLYRFHLLSASFPRLVVYNPEWNAGYLTTEIVASGALGPFLLSLPLLALVPLERAYGWIVPLLVIGVVPWMIFGALRASGTSRTGAALGAALALAPTTALFRYALVFGVLPFVLSSASAVLAAALFARSFLENRGGAAATTLLVAATSLCLLWPFGALMLLPAIPALLVAAPRLDAPGRRRALAVGAALVAVNVAWLVPLVLHGKALGVLAAQRSPLAASGFSWAQAGGAWLEVVHEIHPALLVLAPVGFLWLARRRRRTGVFLAATALWSLLVVVAGPQVKEHVALDRFALPLAFFLLAGAGTALDRLLDGGAVPWRRAAAAAAVATVLLGVVQAARFYQSRGPFPFRVLAPEIGDLVAAIGEHCPARQRVLVPGFSLHWFGGGHVAALPFLTGRAFVANDFYHRRDYRDAVPPEFRERRRFGEFLDLYNVGCVLTWDDPWRRRLEGFSEATRVHGDGRFAVYRTRIPASDFLVGAGRVEARVGALTVETDDDEVVLKYRFVEGLRTEPPATLEPYPVYGDVRFLRVRTGGHRRVEIFH